MAKKYVAYVGTYTRATSLGIHIFDVDPETWEMTERKVVPINNPSDIAISRSGKYLYSIADQGVQSYKILPDGDLEPMNLMYTGGLRGCYIEVDDRDEYIFVAGYHDGRVSMLRLNEDGSLGELVDGIFHQGIGLNITDRSSMPHVTCVKMSPDYSALCAVDSGLDQVKIYVIDREKEKLHLADILRCQIGSAPRFMTVDKQRKHIYVLGEMSDRVCVYNISESFDGEFECLQKISTVEPGEQRQAAAAYLKFSPDGKHLFATNAGINSVIVYDVDQETGLLTKNCHVKCSGDYPKALTVMPDNEHFVVLSHKTNEMFIYKMNYEKGYYLLTTKPIKIERPNCIYVHELDV